MKDKIIYMLNEILKLKNDMVFALENINKLQIKLQKMEKKNG